MVQKPQASAVADLLRRSQLGRDRLSVDVSEFKHRIDIPSRLKDSLDRNPIGWIGGGLAVGLLASMTLRRSAPAAPKRKSGLVGLAITVAGTLARPLLKTWLTGKLRSTLDSRDGSPPPFGQG